MRQAIIWANYDLGYCRIYASLGLNELISMSVDMPVSQRSSLKVLVNNMCLTSNGVSNQGHMLYVCKWKCLPPQPTFPLKIQYRCKMCWRSRWILLWYFFSLPSCEFLSPISVESIATTGYYIVRDTLVLCGGPLAKCCPRLFDGPLTRYAKLRVAHAPGMPGTFSPQSTSKENAS